MKREKPSMNLVLKLLRLQNWRKLRPAEAAHRKVHYHNKKLGYLHFVQRLVNFQNSSIDYNVMKVLKLQHAIYRVFILIIVVRLVTISCKIDYVL